jgi:hypothetical protein
MGGTGSGNPFKINPSEAEKRRKEAEKAAKVGIIDAEVNAILNKRLIEVNRRDTEAVSKRLDEIQKALGDQIEGLDRIFYGGSVAKQTYVEGLSDIDSLVVLRAAEYGDLSPGEAMEKLQKALDARLNRQEASDIRVGDLAVTITYADGLEVQLLPAVEQGNQLSIASPFGSKWSAIEPKAFTQRLTAINQSQAGAVVPAIKLAKVVLASEPDSRRPTGYHLEALAVAAFQHYSGPRNPKAMLTHLFESAAANVKRPIPDVTGQSHQVDAYLGGEGSTKRRKVAEGLRGVTRRMKNAPSVKAWEALLGDEF